MAKEEFDSNKCVMTDPVYLKNKLDGNISELSEMFSSLSYIRELRRKKLVSEQTFNSVLSAMNKRGVELNQEIRKLTERLKND